MSNKDYEGLKLENQLCFPLYAVSKEIIKKYKPFRDKAKDIPTKIGSCVPLEPEKALVLYQILHEMIEKL